MQAICCIGQTMKNEIKQKNNDCIELLSDLRTEALVMMKSIDFYQLLSQLDRDKRDHLEIKKYMINKIDLFFTEKILSSRLDSEKQLRD